VVNKVILIGDGCGSEIRYTRAAPKWPPSGWHQRNVDEQERREGRADEWHRIVAWRGLAKICGEFLNKGKLVYIEGGCAHGPGRTGMAISAPQRRSRLRT